VALHWWDFRGCQESENLIAAWVPSQNGLFLDAPQRHSVAPNHSPNFYVDEKALVTGVRALAMVAVNFLANGDPD
jgi:metal-dependent amidase/aminoacylase/carboxypeptidase family protein